MSVFDNENDDSDMQMSVINRIFKAAAEGNVANVAEGFSLLPSLSRDCRDKRGWTPLMLAARNGHINVMQALLKDGFVNWAVFYWLSLIVFLIWI